jgi:hypothetical protein
MPEVLIAAQPHVDGPAPQAGSPAAADAPDSPAAADRARVDAARLRDFGAAMRTEAETDVQSARVALADAELRQLQIAEAAHALEKLADGCDTLGRVIDHGRRIGDEAHQAQTLLGTLLLEHETLTRNAADLEARLEELAGQRQGLENSIGAARAAGDIDELTRLRPQLPALDEVAEELRRRLAPIRTRLGQLGRADWTGTQLHGAASAATSQGATYGEFIDAISGNYGDTTMGRAMGEYVHSCATNPKGTRLPEVVAALREHPAFVPLLADVLARYPSVAEQLEA